jgi:chemotaxis protein methyltransferase CheR
VTKNSITSSLNPGIRLHRGAFALLRDLVHERTGLYFDDANLDMFLDKLSPLIVERGFDSLLDYYHLLKYDPCSADEWRNVFDALTVQESFFWREMDQIRALVDGIVPQYFRAHPHHTLNIWSGACAAGEEPLTIAMTLHEAGWFDRARINIFASDASPRAVEAAKHGVYRERSFRSLPPELREKYFVCADGGGGWRADSELHSRVRWRIANLMAEDDLTLAPTASPVIFCRNVFIYFSESAARKAVRGFAERMPRPGYLFVGMAESLLRITSDFELREIGGAFVYIRN